MKWIFMNVCNAGSYIPMSRKGIYQVGHQEEGVVGRINIFLTGIGEVWFSLGFHQDTEPRWKATIRQIDRIWVCKNIPSSIWWNLEVHHEWKDGGRMYLLTKQEHKRRTG